MQTVGQLNNRVIILNTDYTFLNVVDWKKAFKLVEKGKVEVLKYSTSFVKTAAGKIKKIPLLLKLIKIVRTIYRTKVPFSKKNVIIRDGFRCVYCGKQNVHFTMDHVKPKSKGGKSTFENVVTACRECNNAKGNLTCSQAKMWPKTKMISPTISEFLRMKIKSLGIEETLNDFFTSY